MIDRPVKNGLIESDPNAVQAQLLKYFSRYRMHNTRIYRLFKKQMLFTRIGEIVTVKRIYSLCLKQIIKLIKYTFAGPRVQYKRDMTY